MQQTNMEHGSVAQLDRASVFGTEGWGFESLRAYLGRTHSLIDDQVRVLTMYELAALLVNP